ncbi:uncharacterized protein LOC108625746 isoform X2 [Ceratina calcarata]|uniref:Uncharacterized protein LOC108625746 isoform X2 n=1 Tax=Ceratina calcarata TaxID=156304 RepID=A0AAJ7J110_9HYME|nr:uncharacterized protein LOC108625746 isoform X2 [Ceratina calcarata]
MDKSTHDTSRTGYHEDVPNHSKKSKKRSSKRSSMLGPWMNSMQNNQNNDTVPGMEYQHLLWQSNVQQSFANNRQRLFATSSDPSMCGYGQMPVTYTMEPVSLPTMYRLYQPMPFSGIRTVHNRPRRHCNQNHPMNLGTNSMGNGYTSLQENGMESPVPINYQNGDYASLPPTANKNDGINGDELNCEHRRYSDPGLGPVDPPVHAQSEDSDSADSGSSITTIGRSNKLVLSLIEQMTELKKSNSQLFKELNETKSELGSMKTKLSQCKYGSSSDYQPGMLSDFIREIRQANKTCEEGLVSKVKSMIEEQLSQKSLEISDLHNKITKLLGEKEESDRRIGKLEEELATLKLNANNEGREIAAFEEETLALRRELQEARASKCLAEGHAGKCVNARSVTPVANFDATQPYVTSTPVRTALSDTQSLIPASSSSSQRRFSSSLHSLNAELAHHLATDEAARQNADRSGFDKEQRTTDSLDFRDADWREDSTINGPEAETEGLDRREETNIGDIKRDGETGDVETNTNPVTEKKPLSRVNRPRVGLKKPRKKKGNLQTKRSAFSEELVATERNNETDVRRTVSEDEDRSRVVDEVDDETRRATITEIPEVAVVGGGSFVPKDLCSTGILTSRVLTAPSRATYTTAYI